MEVLAFRVQTGGGGIPYQFLLMLPYIATILVMIPSFRRVRVPAFLGQTTTARSARWSNYLLGARIRRRFAVLHKAESPAQKGVMRSRVS